MRPEKPEEKPEKEGFEIIDWLRKLPKLLLASLFLLAMGFLLGIIGKIKFFQILFSIGFSLLFIWAGQEIYKRFPRLLKKEQVLESWNVLIQNAQGKAETVFEDTQSLINESKAPDIEMRQESVVPSVIRGIIGGRRKFLVIRNNTNRNLKTYQMYINARDYGNNLHISWYLVTRIGFWRTLMAVIFFFIARQPRPETLVMELDLFDQQDLTAYITNAHHCLVEAVEKLMVNMGQDPSRIDRKSRGFLGIS